jgi:hypothetical protein
MIIFFGVNGVIIMLDHVIVVKQPIWVLLSSPWDRYSCTWASLRLLHSWAHQKGKWGKSSDFDRIWDNLCCSKKQWKMRWNKLRRFENHPHAIKLFWLDLGWVRVSKMPWASVGETVPSMPWQVSLEVCLVVLFCCLVPPHSVRAFESDWANPSDASR